MKAKIIALANHKGGVGKTASVAAIGAILANKGKHVLLVDLDTQANLTMHFMPQIPARIVYHAIRERQNLPIYPVRQNLDIVPSGLDMAGIEVEMTMMRRREDVIKELLEPIRNNYDYILLDCPPSLGLITMNAISASNKLVVPMIADLMSSYGLSMMERFCADLQDLNPGIHVDAIFFTKYASGENMTAVVEEDVRNKYGDRVLKHVVHKNVAVAEAAFQYTDVVTYKPDCTGAKDYTEVTNELLEML